jgi:signal transduction histidine kinase
VFLFPMSVGYAILRRDLFEIDAVLRNAISWVAVALAIGTTYALLTFVAGLLVPSGTLVAQAPFVLAVVNTILVFLVVPLRVRTQAAVDRWFFRHAYDAQAALGELSRTLGGVESFDAVTAAAAHTLAGTLAPTSVVVYLHQSDGRLVRADANGEGADAYPLDADLLARLRGGEVVARYEWEDGSGRPLPAIWHELDAELLVPIRNERGLEGMLVLGRRKSGRAYAGPDVAFLVAVANQLALGIEDVRLLRRLEQKQASLMRADRLATLGRLTSGLAHEMGSPIGAVLSSLRVLDQLGREYAASIDAPMVSPDDHREIAAEMIATAGKATEWAERASAFLKRITTQSREPTSDARRRFRLAGVVAEISALMAHRLRASGSPLEVEEEGEPATVVGDPTALGQVLTNLIGNALDAYEDAGQKGGRIRIGVRREGYDVVITVEDWAGGMPPDVLARIFDELYTTKDVGRGTGLGLWISRNVIEKSFAGTLRAESEAGVGSRFYVTIPAPGVAPVAADPMPAAAPPPAITIRRAG